MNFSASVEFTDMNTLEELQKWYQSQCNGDWEHCYGLKINTLDNPGWQVTIDIGETFLAEQPFTEVVALEHETEWIDCRVRNGKFEGHGGPGKLEEILHVFLKCACECEKSRW